MLRIETLPNIAFGKNSWRGDRAFRDLLDAGLWAKDIWMVVNNEDDDKGLWWSNEDGWVDYPSATWFTRKERFTYSLPIGGEWFFIGQEK